MAFHSYIQFKGQKQGAFHGESLKKGRTDWSEVEAFEEVTQVPIDSKSGRTSGHRTHFPIRVTKERGAASPQILQAIVTNETLTTVIIEVVGHDGTGAKEVVVERTTLTNACFSEFRRFVDLPTGEHSDHDTDNLETVALTFQKIELDCIPGKTQAVDDWQDPTT
jgi:type VI secretion system secreted protein Hcp